MDFGKCELGYCPFDALDDPDDLVDRKCDGCEHWVIFSEDDPDVIAATEVLSVILGKE